MNDKANTGFLGFKSNHRVLGSGPLSTVEWAKSSAYYGRLTFKRQPDLYRSSNDFQLGKSSCSTQTWGQPGSVCSLYLRRDFLDLGVVSNQRELESKLRQPPFCQMLLGDIFQARIGGSPPMIWQFGPTYTRVLCPVPKPFDDSFPVLQEWEKCHDGRGYVLRLDYLHHLPLPSGSETQSPANMNKLKAALSISGHSDIVREVQVYHTVSSIYSVAQGADTLMRLGFYRTSEGNSGNCGRKANPVLRVQLHELTSMLDQYPSSMFSDQALREIHNIQHNRHKRQAVEEARTSGQALSPIPSDCPTHEYLKDNNDYIFVGPPPKKDKKGDVIFGSDVYMA